MSCNTETGEIALDLSSADLTGELPALDGDAGAVAFTRIDFSANPGFTGTFPAT